MIYIATLKDKKKHVKNRYYRMKGFVFLCFPLKMSQIAPFTSSAYEEYFETQLFGWGSPSEFNYGHSL